MAARSKIELTLVVTVGLIIASISAPAARAEPLDTMSLERWAMLRETERYQLNLADKFYREKKWKIAADEYEKFLRLHERSEGAAYAQLRWSVCQVHLRKLNTAIKDGFQTVIDYFPEAPEAVSAAYYIGNTYKDMSEYRNAKKAYANVLAKYGKTPAGVLARVDLLEIARKEDDTERRVQLLKELTYEVERKGDALQPCRKASYELARHYFSINSLPEGLKALGTSVAEDQLPAYIRDGNHGNLLNIVYEQTGSADANLKAQGGKLADSTITWLTGLMPQGATPADKAKSKQLWYNIAEVHAYARRTDKQRQIYDQMLTKFGADDALLGTIAAWCKANAKRDEARLTYMKYADAIEGLNQVANSWREEQKFEKAIEVYQQLAGRDDKNAPRWLTQVAACWRLAGKPDPALVVYRDLAQRDVSNAQNYHWEIAETLYQFRRWQDAITAFRGTDRFPTNYMRMAQANRNLNKYDDAKALYRQIVATDMGHASWAVLQLAYTHEEAGEREPAITMLKAVCAKFPTSGEASTAHVRLNSKYGIRITLGGTIEGKN